MNFSQARRSKGWVVLLATLLGLAFGGYSFISKARANHIYALTCGIVDYKPGVIFKTCADGGIGVGNIEWESWSQTGARGKGIYAINNCLPDCASGKIFQTPVKILLSGSNPLKRVGGKRVLSLITIKTLNAKPLPQSSSNTDTWVLE